MVNLEVELAGIKLKNPLIACSGTFGIGLEYAKLTDTTRLGAITAKGISSDPWEGNPPPRIAETPSGMLNSIGLQNKGVKHFVEVLLPKYISSPNAKLPLIVNVLGHSLWEYSDVIKKLEEQAYEYSPIVAYEINISCPNVDSGGAVFGTNIDAAAKVVKLCREATQMPLIVKLSPNVTDITEIARAAQDAGADAVSLINTLLGMAIDPYTKKTILARRVGGLSGPAIKPIALRMIYEVANAIKLPIIGMGGVTSGTDAVEFMLAGATAVGIGSTNFIDPNSPARILKELMDYCTQMGVDDINDLIGALDGS